MNGALLHLEERRQFERGFHWLWHLKALKSLGHLFFFFPFFFFPPSPGGERHTRPHQDLVKNLKYFLPRDSTQTSDARRFSVLNLKKKTNKKKQIKKKRKKKAADVRHRK